MAHLYCNGGNRFNFVSIRNYTQNNFGGGYSYGCSMPSFGGIFSNWGTGIYTGCACNGGWSWSAFAGNTFGSLVGNVLGMLWGGNNGLYSGIGYTSGSTQGQRTTGNNGNDTDYKKINDLADNMKKNETLISAKTNCTITQEHNLARSLTEPKNITWNEYNDEMIPSDWVLPNDYTKPEAKDISDTSIIKVEDTSDRTADIPVRTSIVSVADNNTNGFPLTLEITSKNGKHWYYHYAGEEDGCPVYITPKTDTNNNVYVLCKQGNDYKLMQFEDFKGYGMGDSQNNK